MTTQCDVIIIVVIIIIIQIIAFKQRVYELYMYCVLCCFTCYIICVGGLSPLELTSHHVVRSKEDQRRQVAGATQPR